jgi:hypothetical protein
LIVSEANATTFATPDVLVEFIAPMTGVYEIDAYGGQGNGGGGGYTGGLGAEVSGIVNLSAGNGLWILVGGAGVYDGPISGGFGGEATFVSTSEANPNLGAFLSNLVIAAGGGGGAGYLGNGGPGVTSNSGANGSGTSSCPGGSGGINTLEGPNEPSCSSGFNDSGAFSGPGIGQGLIGGGATYTESGGGGGGYSGGGAGNGGLGGGGGGSYYNSGLLTYNGGFLTSVAAVAGENSGDGSVVITLQEPIEAPEPGSLALLGSGIGLLAGYAGHRRRGMRGFFIAMRNDGGVEPSTSCTENGG